MKTTSGWGLATACLISGCLRHGGSSGGGGGGGAQPTAAEQQSADTAAGAVGLAESVLGLSDALFAFDPDIDPSTSAAKNASKIQSNAGAASCAKVTASNATSFTVDFGSGCTFGGVKVSGELGVGVSLLAPSGARSVVVSLTFTKMVIDAFDVDGTAQFTTSNGFKFGVAFDVTHQGAHDTADLTVVGAKGSFTVAGSFTTVSGSDSTALAFTGVEIAKGACWPRAGSIAIDSDTAGVTLGFDADTATTGLASLKFQVGAHEVSSCYALPGHGACNAMTCAAS
jgi:hypothetical protein